MDEAREWAYRRTKEADENSGPFSPADLRETMEHYYREFFEMRARGAAPKPERKVDGFEAFMARRHPGARSDAGSVSAGSMLLGLGAVVAVVAAARYVARRR